MRSRERQARPGGSAPEDSAWRALLEESGVTTFVWDLDRDALAWSARAAEVLGSPPPSSPAREAIERLLEIERGALAAALETCKAPGAGPVHFPARLAGQPERRLFLALVPLGPLPERGRGGRLAGALRILPADDAHAADALIDALPVGAWRWSATDGVLEGDAATARLFGLGAARLRAPLERWLGRLHPDDVGYVREALTELSPGRPLVLDRKVRAVDGAGWRWLALRGKVMAGPDGLRVDGTAWDATELHALAGEREAAVEAQGALLTEVNHRVRNSLQLLSALLALQARRATSPEARAALAEARDRTADVARLHQRLYREGRTATVRISELLADLARDAGGGRGKVRFHGPGAGAERNVPTDRALSLGVMAAELLRAAGAGSQESVRLDLRFEGAPETLLIRVSGPGPTGPATIAQEVTGLLAAQLGADVNTGTLADVAFTEVRMPLRAGEANQGAHEAENGE